MSRQFTIGMRNLFAVVSAGGDPRQHRADTDRLTTAVEHAECRSWGRHSKADVQVYTRCQSM